LTTQDRAGEDSTLLDPEGAATRNASAAITAVRAIRATTTTRLTVSPSAAFAVVDSRFLKEILSFARQTSSEHQVLVWRRHKTCSGPQESFC
jgi:hypothetical protein